MIQQVGRTSLVGGRMSRWSQFGLGLGAIALVLSACGENAQITTAGDEGPETLRIFWNQGFYLEEDQALQDVIDRWEAQTQIQVDLSLISSDDILNQTMVALQGGNPPDIVFAHRADYTLQPLWAWEGKLLDLTDVIEPHRDRFSPAALESALLYNAADDTRSYYGVPLEQQALHIHYWRDLLAEAQMDETQIPTEWDPFWAFWQKAQDQLRVRGYPDIFGLGLTLSTQGSDTYFFFEQVMDAYDVALFTPDGELQIDDPEVRARLIDTLKWTTQFYKNNYVPGDAVNWLDSDNNVKFLNRATVMTPNPSLSIPASQRENEALYTQQIATQPLPQEPDGEPISYLVSVKQAIVFEDAPNTEAAKEFLAFLLEPAQLDEYVKGSLGRWFPVMTDSLNDPFWADSTDPHVSVAVEQFTRQPTRPFYHVVNPAYSQVQAENVWGQAIGHVIIDGWTEEQAVDEAIATIQQIFTEWERSD